MSSLLKSILLIFEELFYVFFPLSEDERLIKDISCEQFQRKLSIKETNGIVSLSQFSDPEVRAVIHLIKFHRHIQATNLASCLLETYIRAHLEYPIVIIPIPLSAQRERERGYNQVQLVANTVKQKLPQVTVRNDVLRRAVHTKPQSSLSRAERLKNLDGAFIIKKPVSPLTGQHLILLDDVMTTGATLKAAKAALSPLAPASITGIAIAH